MKTLSGYRFRQPIMLGELAIIANKPLPMKLMKALAVIADSLHDQFDRQPWNAYPGKSKESCILSSLAVRDFLQRIGFKDAAVRSVCGIVRARRDDIELHSIGVGAPSTFYAPDVNLNLPGWNGHLVVTIDGHLIDTTLAPWRREHWQQLPEMIVLPVHEPNAQTFPMHGMKPIAVTWLDLPDDKTYEGELIYLDRPENRSWKTAPDASKDRRRAVVEALVRTFGSWRHTSS